MNFDFNDHYWHDCILENIFINRSDPGNNDSIEIVIKWYEDNSVSKLVFKNVYLFKAAMNFGIIANESIDMAYIAPSDDNDLVNFYSKWKGAYDHISLNCYVIKTSSTGSEIKILAETVEEMQLQ